MRLIENTLNETEIRICSCALDIRAESKNEKYKSNRIRRLSHWLKTWWRHDVNTQGKMAAGWANERKSWAIFTFICLIKCSPQNLFVPPKSHSPPELTYTGVSVACARFYSPRATWRALMSHPGAFRNISWYVLRYIFKYRDISRYVFSHDTHPFDNPYIIFQAFCLVR